LCVYQVSDASNYLITAMQAARMEPDTCVGSISTISDGTTFVSDLLISDSSDCRLYSDFM